MAGINLNYANFFWPQVTAVWHDRYNHPRPHQRKILQFKLSETSVEFFASGMSPAVL